MTPARIRAIRFFLKETPYQFAVRLGCDVMDVALMEKGNKKPSDDILLRLAELERILELRGIKTKTIEERENSYESES